MVKRLVEEYAKWSIRNPNRLGGFKLLLEQVNIILADNGEFMPNLGPNLRTKVFRAKKILQQGLGPQLHMSMSPQLAGEDEAFFLENYINSHIYRKSRVRH
jgi:hypothetical protein